jgi:hypothetical protein
MEELYFGNDLLHNYFKLEIIDRHYIFLPQNGFTECLVRWFFLGSFEEEKC